MSWTASAARRPPAAGRSGTARRPASPTVTRPCTGTGPGGPLGNTPSAADAEEAGEVVAEQAVDLVPRDRVQAEGRGLLVDRADLVRQLDGVVEEARVVGAEEQLLQRHEHRLAPLQQHEQVPPGDARQQVGQLAVEVRVLGQQEQRLVDPGVPAVRDDHAQVAEAPADVVQQGGPAELQIRVDPAWWIITGMPSSPAAW